MMRKFSPNLITLAFVTAGLISQSKALAQETPQETPTDKENLEVIEVTGFRGSLIQSLNTKRFSDTIVESVSADDLGALPDVSIGEALARLPGVTSVRTGGQAGAINIRGLSGDFVHATMNGREQVSTSGSRSVEFEQYPSELIQSAAVYKSPKASLIEGGVAGSIELTTVSPLDLKQDSKFSMNLRGSYNDRAGEVPDAKESGHRLTLSYQQKNSDETFGFALGYSRLFQPDVQEQFIGLQYFQTGNDFNGDGRADAISEGMELQHRGGEETRDGFLAALEWQPSDTLHVKADAFYSKFDSKSFARGLRIKDFSDRADGGTGGNAEVIPSEVTNPVVVFDTLIGATINTSDRNRWLVQTTNDNNTEDQSLLSTGIKVNWTPNDDLSLSFDLAYSKAESDFVNGVNWSLMADDSNAVDLRLVDEQITYRLSGVDIPSVINLQNNYTNVDERNAVMMSKYGTYPFEFQDESTAARVDLSYELENEHFSSIEAGVRYAERHYRADRSVFEYGFDFDLTSNEAPLRLTNDMVQVVNFSGDFAHFPSYLTIDLDKALPAWFDPLGVDYSAKKRWSNDWTMIQSGDVFEDVLAGYLQANIDTEIGNIPVSGNLGVRVVRSDQYAEGLQNVQGEVAAGARCIADEVGVENCDYAIKRVGKTYTDVLPSINLNFQLSDTDQVRIAAAKVMARPPIGDLRAGIGSWYDNDARNNPEAQGPAVFNAWGDTSPLLDPFYATQFDISYERYFEETDGAFVVAAFYKDIESFVEKLSIAPYDFAGNGFDIPTEIEETGQQVIGGRFNTSVNNSNGGYIRGIEIAYTQTLSFLPKPFDGLGVTLNYAYTESEIETENISGTGNVDNKANLEGLSPNVFSGVLYYQYEGFDTRVSMRYVDDFVGDQVATDAQLVYYADELVIDYQASYAFSENLSGLFQVTNLTDEPTRTYFGDEQLTGTIQYFGRTVFAGFNYQF
jgi:TonB-dependent receptor